jgi:hypothetical protein
MISTQRDRCRFDGNQVFSHRLNAGANVITIRIRHRLDSFPRYEILIIFIRTVIDERKYKGVIVCCLVWVYSKHSISSLEPFSIIISISRSFEIAFEFFTWMEWNARARLFQVRALTISVTWPDTVFLLILSASWFNPLTSGTQPRYAWAKTLISTSSHPQSSIQRAPTYMPQCDE